MSYPEGWKRKPLIPLEWTLIRIQLTMEIFKNLKKTGIKKELKSSLVELKSKFR